ncbi:MAG: hypothetical protein LBP86_02375 [Azoarcus sp.]|jgi:type IV pilus assembly protein PilY1|nr:hypothetical protein [Azoarcus sp.]
MKTLNRPQPAVCPPSPWIRPIAYAVAAAFSVAAMPALADLDIPEMPLIAGSGSSPNVLYIHDDSSSMYYSFMPDLNKIYGFGGQAWYCSDSAPGICRTDLPRMNEPQSKGLRSPQVNFIYYNPNITYEPPPAPPGVNIPKATPPGTLGNADFNNAWFNGYDISGRDESGSGVLPRRVNLSTSFKATYSYGPLYDPNIVRPGEYLSYQGSGSAAHYYDCPSGLRSTCTRVDITTSAQKQNFANWYSYYRNRNMAARAGIARAFVQFGSNVRVGWGKINKSSQSTIDGKSVTTVEQGMRPFTDARKKDFVYWLYGISPDGTYTPLRRALDGAGQYYDRSSSSHIGPWADNPATGVGTETASCRRSFTILMTDGYWNGAAASTATGNQDGPVSAASFTTPPKPDGSTESWSKKPFRDSYSDTLADVAWYYWAKDLLPNSPNNIGGVTRDPAWWQHMTTYAIGLGVAPDTADKSVAFRAADTGNAPGFTWPAASVSQIDDLLHAGVNGHGDFFSAGNPEEFAKGMQSIVGSIVNITAGSGKSATNEKQQGDSGKSDALVFDSTYQTDNWSGELSAREVSAITEENLNGIGRTVWEASSAMPSPGARRIFTRSNAATAIGSTGIEFVWAALSAQQKLDLQEGEDAAHGQAILDYLRGSGAKEASSGGSFRDRDRADASRAPLGDSPNNGMIYDSDTDTLYLGANDGMLHAFDASTGVERFAYIPSTLFPKLPVLAHADYSHKYYVDGEAAVAEADDGQRYLIGALGRGGKVLYGLRVTTPAAFSSRHVLWEINGRTDAAQCGTGANANILDDLGIITGKPATAKLADGKTVAIVGNGYNSCRGKASLYIIDVADGKVLHKIDTPATGDNGLSTPFAFDRDGDGVLASGDAIYAGDLKGNLWRFAEIDGTWQVSFGRAAQPMFTARNAAGTVQPITARPTAARHPSTGLPYVFFGTGQFLQGADKVDQTIQSLYGLIDNDSAPKLQRADLRQRRLTLSSRTGTLTDGSTVGLRFVDPAKDGDMDGMRGWVIDFDLASDPGERIIGAAHVITVAKRGSLLEVPSIVPSSAACGGGGYTWINTINPFTGAALSAPFYDLNGDGKADEKDRTEDGDKAVPAGFSLSPKIGMLPETPDRNPENPTCVYGGAYTACPPGGDVIKGRISWREVIKE